MQNNCVDDFICLLAFKGYDNKQYVDFNIGSAVMAAIFSFSEDGKILKTLYYSSDKLLRF